MTSDFLKIAITAAIEAAKEIIKIYESNDFDIRLKSDNSPLTQADLVSHKVIESHLKKTNIPILSEEGKDIVYDERRNWNRLWIVEPLDGARSLLKEMENLQ